MVGASALILATATVAATVAGIPVSGGLTYIETNPGTEQGQSIVGIVGHGTFSMKLGARLPAGVPSTIAQGGSYIMRWAVDAKGDYHGLLVQTFRARALGSLCYSVTIAIGRFDPNAGKSFPPSDGTFTSLGGTGEAARLRLAMRVKLTSVVGEPVKGEQLAGSGTLVASLGAPRPPSAACLAVARLAR